MSFPCSIFMFSDAGIPSFTNFVSSKSSAYSRNSFNKIHSSSGKLPDNEMFSPVSLTVNVNLYSLDIEFSIHICRASAQLGVQLPLYGPKDYIDHRPSKHLN